MLTVDDYGAIRRARRDGMSIRQISRQFGHTRKTVRHVLNHAEPPAPTNRDRKAPRLLGPVEPIIDRILADDEEAPDQAAAHRRPDPSSPPRGARLSRRLCPGPTLRPQAPPAASRDLHPPRPSAGATPRGRLRPHPRRFPRRSQARPVPRRRLGLLECSRSSWPCRSSGPRPSSKGWSPPSSSSAAVPKEVWWDNPRTVATLILKGRERQVHPRLRGAGKPSRLRAQVLHAGPRQREARRREHRQSRPEAGRFPKTGDCSRVSIA